MRYVSEGEKWDPARVRAAKPVATGAGHKVRYHGDPVVKRVMRAGEALRWTEEDGRAVTAQLWCASGPRSVWLLVDPRKALFRGEMRQADVDREGRMSVLPTIYNARGERAHAHDGSACYGAMSYAHGGCPGCNAAKVLPYIGRQVCVREHSTTSLYGATVHLGLLREIRDGRAWLDNGESVSLGSVTSIAAVAA